MPFDVALFRQTFPVFADTTVYPDQTITLWSDIAACSVRENCQLNGACFNTAWQLLTAHIAQTLTRAAQGQTTTGVVTSAGVDKVTVGYAPPPTHTAWAYWLAQSPYGQQLAAMLSAMSVGGFYLGGTVVPERSSFRGAGGFFNR